MQALEQNRTERTRLVDALQHLAKGGGGGYSEAVGAPGCHIRTSVLSAPQRLGSPASSGR
jgi:hypothetical protein